MEKKFMSNNKHFLRVTNTWAELAKPTDVEQYFTNTSGVTIQVHLTDTKIEDPSTIDESIKFFTVGGNIAQICTHQEKYMYARSLSDSDTTQAVLCADNEIIAIDDITAMKDDIDTLSVEIMNLSKRVSDNKITHIDHAIDYELFIRQFLDTTAAHHIQFASVHKHIATIWEELFLAERFIQQHRSEYVYLKDMVEHLKVLSSSANQEDITAIRADLNNVLSSISDCIANINDLNTQVNTNKTNLSNLVTSDVTPMKLNLSSVSANLAALNNALVTFSTNHTPEEIESLFVDFLVTVPADMVEPIMAFKNDMVKLVTDGGVGDNLYTPTGAKLLTTDDILYIGGNNAETIEGLSSLK
jgi:hypothetical protein